MAMGALKALAAYFNTGPNKKPLREFAAEIKLLNAEEKAELGQLACAAMGETYEPDKAQPPMKPVNL